MGSTRRSLLLTGASLAATAGLGDIWPLIAAAQQGKPIDPEATFRFMHTTNGGSNYDPHTAINVFAPFFMNPVFDRLIWRNPQSLKLEPMLAESWSFSADGTVLTLNLRRGVTFHDGTPFDAQAVKLNLERPNKLPRANWTKRDLSDIKSIEIADSHKVMLHLSAPSLGLPYFLSAAAGMMISPAVIDSPDLGRMPVGAGAYKVVKHDPGRLVVYERYEKYWNKTAQRVRSLEFSIQLNNQTRLNAVRSGQADATLPGYAASGEDNLKGLQVVRGDSSGHWGLSFNKTRKPFDDARVRRAMYYAIDRETIHKALIKDAPPTLQPFMAKDPAYNPELKANYYPYDPKKAKALLAEAGVPDGFKFSTGVSNTQENVTLAEIVAQQLSLVGIQMQVSPLNPAELVPRYVIKKDLDSLFAPNPGNVDAALIISDLYLSTSRLNPGGYVNKEVDELARIGRHAATENERWAAYRKLIKIATDEALQLILWRIPDMVVARPNVQGISPGIVTAMTDFRQVSIVKGA